MLIPDNSQCDIDVQLPTLDSSASCNIGDICTEVECCIQSDRLPTTFYTHVCFDQCRKELTVELEMIRYVIQLKDYTFGKFLQDYLYIKFTRTL